MNMSLPQVVSNLKTQQAVLNSTYDYGGGFSPGFDLGRNHDKGKLEASMGLSPWSQFGSIFNGRKDFRHAFERQNQEYLNAANAYLTATTPEQKQTILQNLATQQGIIVDPNRDYTQEMLDIKTTLEIPRGVQTELTHRQMYDYQAHQEAYLKEIERQTGVNISTAPTENEGVVDLRTLRIKETLSIPDEAAYLTGKVDTLARLLGEGSPELQKYQAILQNQNGTDFRTKMAAVIARAQADVAQAAHEARESQPKTAGLVLGGLDEKQIMVEALQPSGQFKGDPAKFEALKKKMQVLEQLQPGSDIKPQAEVARFNTNLGQAGFSWGTQDLKPNTVVSLASGADTLNNDTSIKQVVNGTLVRSGKERILKEEKDTIYTQIGDKYFKKISKFDEKTGLRQTEVQEVNSDGQALNKNKTVYLQARNKNGTERGDLIRVDLDNPESKASKEALQKAQDTAKKSKLQQAGQNLVPPPLNPTPTTTASSASSTSSNATQVQDLDKRIASVQQQLNRGVTGEAKINLETRLAELKEEKAKLS